MVCKEIPGREERDMGRTLVRPEWADGRKREEPRYWDEDDPRALYTAVAEACHIYQYRNLRENLEKFGWKQARKRVLAYGALSNEWARYRHGDVRIRRRGLEVRFQQRTRLINWRELQDFVRVKRF